MAEESDRGSLLALDSFASEESLRVAAYARALVYRRNTTKPLDAEVIAERFVSFIGGQRWRLDALDTAIENAGRRANLDKLISSADKIVAWVCPPEPVTQDPDPAPDGGPAKNTSYEETEKKVVVPAKKKKTQTRRY
jgi:hypothetical protein